MFENYSREELECALFLTNVILLEIVDPRVEALAITEKESIAYGGAKLMLDEIHNDKKHIDNLTNAIKRAQAKYEKENLQADIDFAKFINRSSR